MEKEEKRKIVSPDDVRNEKLAGGGITMEKNAPYQSPTPGEFPIIAESPFAMDLIKNPSQMKISAVDEIIDCGFNVGMELVNDETLNRILLLLSESAKTFKFMPASSHLHDERYVSYLAKYKNNTGIGGWNFKDEPNFNELDALYEQYKKIRNVDPSHLVFINLLGGASEAGTNNLEFADYLNYFQNKFAPGLWSYDIYPVRIDKNDALSIQYRQFYRDFQAVSKISKETKRPFWAFVQSMAFRNSSNYGCPAPKEEYMRYEAFTALAYGAQGIIYWTYAQRRNPSSGVETYSTALIDINGNKTEYWNYAKNVNSEIKKFATIFLGCSLVKYAHIGDLGRDLWDLIPPTSIANFGPIFRASSADKGAVFTIVHNEEVDYVTPDFVVMVNHSPLESSVIDLSFLSNYEVMDLTDCKESDFSDAIRVVSGKGYVLPAGAYRIFAFSEK